VTGLRDQIACVEREIALRKRVYPQLVERTKLTQRKATDEIACMEAVLLTLREIHDKERLL
jgi:hypothetical protein